MKLRYKIVLLIAVLFAVFSLAGTITYAQCSDISACQQSCRVPQTCYSTQWVYLRGWGWEYAPGLYLPCEGCWTTYYGLGGYCYSAAYMGYSGYPDYFWCYIYQQQSVPYDCSYYQTQNKPDWTDCTVGSSYGECLSGTCYDCDYDSGNYCVNGPYHYGSYICNSWTKIGSVCCGDEFSGEVYRTSTYDGTTACCDSSTDCVLASTCYNNGDKACFGSILGSCNAGTVGQTTCTYGCTTTGPVSAECIPGPATNLLVNGQSSPSPIAVGDNIIISWTDPNWQGSWHREGIIRRLSDGATILSDFNMPASPYPAIPTAGSEAGNYQVEMRICNSGSTLCSNWATLQFALQQPGPQISSLQVNPNPVNVGRDVRFSWTDPTWSTPQCPDGTCNAGAGENCQTCPQDCGACPPPPCDLSVNSPPDISYQVGAAGNSITWTPSSTNTPIDYRIFRKTTLVQSGTWASGTPITIPVDGLPAGTVHYISSTAPDGVGTVLVLVGDPVSHYYYTINLAAQNCLPVNDEVIVDINPPPGPLQENDGGNRDGTAPGVAGDEGPAGEEGAGEEGGEEGGGGGGEG